MIFLANENIPEPSIRLLKKEGQKVVSIRENFPGISDKNVIQLAIDNSYIILTLDSDYGNLIFRGNLKKAPSVVYFRDKGNNPLFVGKKLIKLITENISFVNKFTVIEEENVRQKFY